MLPGHRRVFAGCFSATCVPAFEFHGNPAWTNPFEGDVTLTGAGHDPSKCMTDGAHDSDCCAGLDTETPACADGFVYERGADGCGRIPCSHCVGTICRPTANYTNITSYGSFSFHSFNGTLNVKGSTKLERIGESAFSNAGGAPGVMPILEFNGDFQFLTSIGDNAFKAIGRVPGGKTFKTSGLTFKARNAFALRYIGKAAFGGLYTDSMSFHVSSQCSEPLVVHSQAFAGTTQCSVSFISLDCNTLKPTLGSVGSATACDVNCFAPQKKEVACPLSKYRPTGDRVVGYAVETCCEAAGEIPCTRERYAGCGA